MPAVRSIVHASASDKYRFSALVLNIVNSPAFQMNIKEPATVNQQAAPVDRKGQ
jgi:hypothetical protein